MKPLKDIKREIEIIDIEIEKRKIDIKVLLKITSIFTMLIIGGLITLVFNLRFETTKLANTFFIAVLVLMGLVIILCLFAVYESMKLDKTYDNKIKLIKNAKPTKKP